MKLSLIVVFPHLVQEALLGCLEFSSIAFDVDSLTGMYLANL